MVRSSSSKREADGDAVGSLGAPRFFLVATSDKRLAPGFAAMPKAHGQFDQPVKDKADPGVDQQAPVEAVWFVARGRRQVWHEDEEVQQTSEDDGGGLLEESLSHRPHCNNPSSDNCGSFDSVATAPSQDDTRVEVSSHPLRPRAGRKGWAPTFIVFDTQDLAVERRTRAN